MEQTTQMEYSEQSNLMDFTDIKNEIDVISYTSNLSTKQSQYNTIQSPQLKSLPWHEKLRLQAQRPVNVDLPKKYIQYAHTKGLRNSVQFQQKEYYTFEELLILINRIDEAWENNLHTNTNISYID